MKQINKLLSVTLLSSALLTACGGGGGGGGSDPAPRGPANFDNGGNTSKATINDNNSDALARAVAEAFGHAAGLASYETIVHSVFDSVAAQLDALFALFSPTYTGMPTQSIGGESGLRQINQVVSSIAAAGDDNDLSTICTPGEAHYTTSTAGVTLHFNECTVQGYETDGQVLVTFTNLANLGVNVSFSNFNVANAGESFNLDGVKISCESLRDSSTCRITSSDFYGTNGKVYRVTYLSYISGQIDLNDAPETEQLVNTYSTSITKVSAYDFENSEAHAIRVFDYDNGYIDFYTDTATTLDISGCNALPIAGSFMVGTRSGAIVNETGAITVNACEDYTLDTNL